MARLIKGLETKLIHAGEPEPLIEGAVAMPIFQSSTYEYGERLSNEDSGVSRKTGMRSLEYAPLAFRLT